MFSYDIDFIKMIQFSSSLIVLVSFSTALLSQAVKKLIHLMMN